MIYPVSTQAQSNDILFRTRYAPCYFLSLQKQMTHENQRVINHIQSRASPALYVPPEVVKLAFNQESDVKWNDMEIMTKNSCQNHGNKTSWVNKS